MRSFSATSAVLVALMAILTFSSTKVDATALTYNVAAHERACFYTWVDAPKKKLAFYFAVSKSTDNTHAMFCLFGPYKPNFLSQTPRVSAYNHRLVSTKQTQLT